jgi:hypothetical protein
MSGENLERCNETKGTLQNPTIKWRKCPSRLSSAKHAIVSDTFRISRQMASDTTSSHYGVRQEGAIDQVNHVEGIRD